MLKKIDKRLNLVFEYAREDGSKIYAHSTPIQREVFDQYKEVAFQAVNALYTRGLGVFVARHAADMLRRVAQEYAGADDAAKVDALARVENGFLAELRRLTHVLAQVPTGAWEMRTFEDAKRTGLIDEDEAEEIENAVCFFTCALRAHTKAQHGIVWAALNACGARPESLSCTEFMRSLQTSMPGVSSGVKAIA